MKRLALVVLFLGLMISVASAETLSLSETLGKLPPLKQGVAWSLSDSKLNYLSTIEAVSWKGLNLEVGYAGAAENTGDKAVGVISYKIASLKDMGVTLPILDLIELNAGVYAGYGRISAEGQDSGNNEFDWGLSATVLNIKW